MAKSKQTTEPTEPTELAVVEDLMAPVAAPVVREEDAGLGSEDITSDDVVLPRVTILQGLSQAVSDGLPGAKAGVPWTIPHNRPAVAKGHERLRFVLVRIYPAWRKWVPRDEGSGLECEAPTGDLVATSASGLTGARLFIESTAGRASTIDWVDGQPTSSCSECVYGPAAAAAAAGKKPTGRSGSPARPCKPRPVSSTRPPRRRPSFRT